MLYAKLNKGLKKSSGYLPHSVFLIILLSLQFNKVLAQYYPGGIGNSNLKIWVNANINSSLTYNGSNQVSAWNDLSGNGYNFGQATTSQMPVYVANGGPNSLPALKFTVGSSQYLSTPTLPSSISFSAGLSSLSIVNYTNNSPNWNRIFDFGNGSGVSNIWFGRANSSNEICIEGWNPAGGRVYGSSNSITPGSNNMFEAVQQGGTPGNNTLVSMFSAGTQLTTTSDISGNVTPLISAVNRVNNYIGRSNWSGDSYYDGTMSEILFLIRH